MAKSDQLVRDGVIPIDPEKMSDCDGCGIPMNFRIYQDHNCPAYAHHEQRNPWHHKMGAAVWKVPGGRVVARGRCITKDDIAAELSRG